MSTYQVSIARRAAEVVNGLSRQDQQRVRAAIDLLAEQPCPPGCVPGCVAMAGEPHAYRVRVGDYRMVYEVFDSRLVVQAVRVGPRRDVYRH